MEQVASEANRAGSSTLTQRDEEGILSWLVSELARELKMSPDDIDVSAPFESLGVTSLAGVALAASIGDGLAVDIPATLFWDYPTLERLAAYLATLAEA